MLVTIKWKWPYIFSLSWLHGVLNPVIYSFLSYGYRNRLKKLWARVRDLLTCFKPCYAVMGTSYRYENNSRIGIYEYPFNRSTISTFCDTDKRYVKLISSFSSQLFKKPNHQSCQKATNYFQLQKILLNKQIHRQGIF